MAKATGWGRQILKLIDCFYFQMVKRWLALVKVLLIQKEIR
jgi:hypothetical protein